MTSTSASTDLVNYRCFENTTFIFSVGSASLQMNNPNDSVKTDTAVKDLYKISLTYSAASTLSYSDIGIYIKEVGGTWSEVAAGVKYTSVSIDAELPYKGDFLLKICNKKGTDFKLYTITYFIENCNCVKHLAE